MPSAQNNEYYLSGEGALEKMTINQKPPKCYGNTSRKIRRLNKCQRNCPAFKECGQAAVKNQEKHYES